MVNSLRVRVGRAKYLLEPIHQQPKGWPAYLYGRYATGVFAPVYALQARRIPAMVNLVFANEDVTKVLRQASAFNCATFTFIPETFDLETYEYLYEQMVFSPRTSSYMTWFGSLALQPYRHPRIQPKVSIYAQNSVRGRSVIGMDVRLPPCPADCILLQGKQCGKDILFPEIYNPLRGVPSLADWDAFCHIQRHFALRLAKDWQQLAEDVTMVGKMRDDMNIKSMFWLDPYVQYSHPKNVRSPEVA